MSLLQAVAVCLAGIAAGDLGLFLAGRFAGARLLRWRWVQRWCPPSKVESAGRWLSERGLWVVLISRFTPGLRLPTYFAAGMLPTPMRAFTLYFLAAAAVWTPLLVGGASLLGEQTLRAKTLGLEASGIFIAAALAGRYLLLKATERIPWRSLTRYSHWEFWPAWAAYLPVVPYILYLGLRYRGLTLFTAANPGMPAGGFAGESKSRILEHLNKLPGVVPEFALLPGTLPVMQRKSAALHFMASHALTWPVVLKPDVGQRGEGVEIVRSEPELEAYLARNDRDTLIQRHVEGVEYGVFYLRFPQESRGRVVSITRKDFPEVVGDGRSPLRGLIEEDSRARLLLSTYERLSRRSMDFVPEPGQRVRLVEIGSHCRGAIFLDATSLVTPELERAIDAIAKAHPGFYFGRFDLRVPNADALRRGENLWVLELNGVTAEATHVYDPAVSLVSAYRTIFLLWRAAFAIGDWNRAQGCEPARVHDLWLLARGASEAGAAQEVRANPRLQLDARS